MEIEEKTHGFDISTFDLEEPVFCLVELVIPQVKCHLLCFVLILGELVPVSREVVFDLEDLIVSHVYSLYFTFFSGDLVLTPRKNSSGRGKNCPPGLFLD